MVGVLPGTMVFGISKKISSSVSFHASRDLAQDFIFKILYLSVRFSRDIPLEIADFVTLLPISLGQAQSSLTRFIFILKFMGRSGF